MTLQLTYTERIIARSSAEAELYAPPLGASESKGIASLLKDLGYEMKSVLATNAKAAEHILHRQGFGRVKHLGVAYLWMQDEVGSKRLRVRRVKSEENVAGHQSSDCETLPHTGLRQHGRRKCLVQASRCGDVSGLWFGPNDRDGWQNRQHAAHSK